MLVGIAAVGSKCVQQAVRIRVPSGLNAECLTYYWWSKEAMSLPEAASQSLAVLSELAVRIRVSS
jgi:hypothetical protein